MPRQDQDDQAYLTYYDFETQTGFAWNGTGKTVDVMDGGLNERITDSFEMGDIMPWDYSTSLGQHASYFKQECQRFLAEKVKEMVTIDADFK